VTPVDINLVLPRDSSSGCEGLVTTGEPGDFAGFPAGNIALLQRGTCTFEDKVENAAAAGAVGAIIFNQGNTPEREVLLEDVTLGATNTSGIPVVGTSFARGEEWATTAGLVMHVFTNVERETKTTFNVLAETRFGNDDNVVVVGAHLDSVRDGPGINDNGSGSAAILEVAENLAKIRVKNTVRFAWWGAEESNLIGSDFYVLESLTEEELADIALYLNFDMIGSPNFVRFVYDGDGSAFGLPGPDGSAAIEQLFVDFYSSRGLASEPTQIDFRSDYSAFFESDIPFGGLFTGAEGIKTPEQVAIYGGVAGQQYDPCYHEACDTFDNVNLDVLDLNADSVAFSTFTYAMSTSSVTGG
jgi:Zn-dependent M28 family amino/carboxypeptidase